MLLRAIPLLLLVQVDSSSPGRVRAEVTGVRSGVGSIGCMAFTRPAGFPSEPRMSSATTWCSISERRATCSFDGVDAGALAVACFHDENGNKTLDRSLFGIPSEGWVVSRDARGFLGPPAFDDARIHFDGGQLELELSLRYP